MNFDVTGGFSAALKKPGVQPQGLKKDVNNTSRCVMEPR